MLLTILLPTFTVTSDIAQKTQTEETIPITIIDMFSNTRSEDVLSKKIFLELYVKVNKDWRSNERQLKRFGYKE